MCLGALIGGRRHRTALTKARFSSCLNLKNHDITVTPVSEIAATPGAWAALPADPATVGTGNWIQAVVDQPGAGKLGFAPEWAKSNGTVFAGTWIYYVPASSTGWYRVWQAADVPYAVSSVNTPTRVLYCENLQDCTVTIDGVDCLGSLLRAVNCHRCRFIVKNVIGRQQASWGNDVACVQEDGGSYNTFELTNVTSQDGAFRSDRSYHSRAHAVNVTGLFMVADAGVCYLGGRSSMSRFFTATGEWIVGTLQANLVQGTNKRVRIYGDDFLSWLHAHSLVLTAHAGDRDVWLGGGSFNTIGTDGVHENEDRDAFTTEWNAWFGVEIPNVNPPLVHTGNTAVGGFDFGDA